MKRIFKSSLFLAVLSIFGFVAYRFSLKMRELKEQYQNCIFFNGKSLVYDGETFEGGSFAVMFSGLEMDLTGATLLDDTTIEIYSEFSGVTIKVPEDWQVIEEGESYRSGFSSKVDTYELDETKPVLYIQYNIRYSGLEILH